MKRFQNILNILILSLSNIENEEALGFDPPLASNSANPFDGPNGSAGVLLEPAVNRQPGFRRGDS